MRIVRENLDSANVKIAENACAADVFFILLQCAQHLAHAVATHQTPPKALCTDSESRILAMKKFSVKDASRRIGARQNRIFARIADSRFARCLSLARRIGGRCGRSARA
jgi:hypothetical protein